MVAVPPLGGFLKIVPVRFVADARAFTPLIVIWSISEVPDVVSVTVIPPG